MVEASEAGARTLGVTYWQAVDRFTRGVVRAELEGQQRQAEAAPAARRYSRSGRRSCRSKAGWSAAGTRSRVDCSRLRAAAPSHSRSDPEGDQQELSVTVEECVPRLAARAGAPLWTGMLYAKGQSPFHVAVRGRYLGLLLGSRDS